MDRSPRLRAGHSGGQGFMALSSSIQLTVAPRRREILSESIPEEWSPASDDAPRLSTRMRRRSADLSVFVLLAPSTPSSSSTWRSGSLIIFRPGAPERKGGREREEGEHMSLVARVLPLADWLHLLVRRRQPRQRGGAASSPQMMPNGLRKRRGRRRSRRCWPSRRAT